MPVESHDRSVRMLTLAENLLADPSFGCLPDGTAVTETPVAEAERVVREVWRRQPPGPLSDAVRSLSYLSDSALVDRNVGYRQQVRALVRTSLALPAGATAFQRPDLAAAVTDSADLVYLLAWLRRLWKVARPEPGGEPEAAGPRSGLAPPGAATRRAAAPPPAPQSPPARPPETAMERAMREAQERKRKGK